MMDYYSSFPAPSYEYCKNDLKNELLNSNTVKDLIERNIINIDEIIEQSFILSDMVDSNTVKGSLTGWRVFGYRDVLNKALYILDELNKKRKIRNKRLIRGLFKSTYLLIKINRESKENMYNPDSDFMKEIYSKYN